MIQYAFPTSTAEALELLDAHQGKARLLAGGTDLMPLLRDGKLSPEVLIDITRIAELNKIERGTDQVTIGAAVPFSTIQTDIFLRNYLPGLVEAGASIGAGGIQGSATLAGNIVQAMPAADGAVAAIALGAEALVWKGKTASWHPVLQLYRSPGKSTVDPTREMIQTIRIPLPPTELLWGTAWSRVGRRSALILPIINCAVNLVLDDTGSRLRIHHARVTIGPAGSIPLLAERAAAQLIGMEPGKELFAEAGKLAAEEAQPRSNPLRASREYRLKIIPAMVRDTLTRAAERARTVPDQ